jgi:plastocyanin
MGRLARYLVVFLFCLKPGYGALVEVSMTGNKFVPAIVTVKVGDTVKWVNKDPRKHNTEAVGGLWKSDSLTVGETYSFVFTTAGTFPYICRPHLRINMVGTVVVQATSGIDPKVAKQPIKALANDGEIAGSWHDAQGRQVNSPGQYRIRILVKP